MILEIFLPCYFGNEIILAAEKFAMDVLHSEWYFGSRQFRKTFVHFMIQASQPLIMVSGTIFHATLENFVLVINISYKFCAVMQNMNAQM